MRVVVELAQREADELMRWDGRAELGCSCPLGDGDEYAIPAEIVAMVGKLRDAIVRAEAFAKAHP
jgi:hypothetical protein